MESADMKPNEEIISFTRREWGHFIDELKMRGIDKIDQCIKNARYLEKLDIADEQFARGEGRKFTWEELNNFINAECMVSK